MTSKYHFSFLGNTVKSIIPNQTNKCEFCNQACGCLYELNECLNHLKLCGECLDAIYDINDTNDTVPDIIGYCPCCKKRIKSYNIVE